MRLTSALRTEYEELYDSCRIMDNGAANWCLNKIQRKQSIYKDVSEKTGVPWYVIAVIHSLESSFDFGTHLHNGDPLSSRTVNVPRGRPVSGNPPFSWEESAVDALEYDGALTIQIWDIATCLWFLEGYNGWGYRTGRGQATTPPKRSPYLWSKTNHYEKGKYVRDSEFDPYAVSDQVGCAALFKGLETRNLISFPDIDYYPKPLLKFGDRGDSVKELQYLLNQKIGAGLSVDGIFGPRTDSAVKRFQELKGLDVDGIVGPNTWAALLERIAAASAQEARPLLKYGDSGESVKELQGLLNQKIGAGLSVDGIFGSRTESAVKRFQESKGLDVDGIVGPNTWAALLEEFVPGDFSRVKLAQISETEARQNITWMGSGEAKKYTRKFEPVFGTGRFPWCAAFATWCCEQAGLNMPVSVPGDPSGFTFALCEAWQQWAIRQKFYHDARFFTPQAGDIAVFDWQGAEYPDSDDENHIGIFLRMDGDYYVFAEGNVGDKTSVEKRSLPIIQGFIRIPDGFSF